MKRPRIVIAAVGLAALAAAGGITAASASGSTAASAASMATHHPAGPSGGYGY